ncbi:MAG: TonB-dependent receptor [Candidatus Acidiferrales bacterium]
MRAIAGHRAKALWFLTTFLFFFTIQAHTAAAATVSGHVVDPLGAAVSGAEVALVRNGAKVARVRTDSDGVFTFQGVAPGRYRVRVRAQGFTPADIGPIRARSEAIASVEVQMRIGPLRQQIVVSATGRATPKSQVGATVSVLDHVDLRSLNKLDVLDALRLVPGVEVMQQGERGGVGSVFVRGGNADFNKVLLDGIAINDIGGQLDFANLAASGVDQLEIFRGPNSILYGSDALAGVILVTTRRGSTPTPQFTYSADGGNFDTLRQEASVGGAFRQFDYYSSFMRFDTQNSLPNSSFHNGTYTGNFGWQPTATTSLRLVVHHDATGLGSAGPLNFYGIADDSFQRAQDTDLGLTVQNQTTSRWHNTLRLASAHIHYFFDNPSPTGIPSNASGFGTNYLGQPVTICGANGYCTSGQAILDFGGSYPMPYNSKTTVQTVGWQSDYAFRPNAGLTGGFDYIHEDGFIQPSGALQTTDRRNNYDYFLEGHGGYGRAFATAGVGFEDNAIFGFAVTPRVSLAYYLRQPAASRWLGQTKARLNFGTGIKEPSISDWGSSLYNLLSSLPGGQALIARYAVSPAGAERSQSFDFGVDQGLWHERALLGVTLFHARYYDLIDFVPQTALPGLGVPEAVAAAVPFGADINSDSYRSQGAEADLEISLTGNLMLKVDYTYLDSLVTRSFSSSALFPAVNPAFPGIAIGAYAPLVGGRPFRRPPHSGGFTLTYSRSRFGLNLNGYLVSRSDDSTYLSDAFFGNTMLLPNRDLLAGYQLIDFNGWYNVHRGVTLYTEMSNVLNERYQTPFGYPALPFTFRSGVRFTLGGGR